MEELEAVVLPYHLDGLKQAAGVAALEFSAEMHARVTAVVDGDEGVASSKVFIGD